MGDYKNFLTEEGLGAAVAELAKYFAKKKHVHLVDDIEGLPIDLLCADHNYPIGWLMVLSAIEPVIISNHSVWLRCDGREMEIEGDTGYPDLIGLGGILPPTTIFWDTTKEMTANDKPFPYLVRASSEYSSNYAAYRAFGKSAREQSHDCWTTGANRFNLADGNAVNGTGEWLEIKLPMPALLTKYSFHSRNVNITVGESSIRDYQLLGSDDGDYWVILDSKKDTPKALVPYQKYEYLVHPSKAYQYYRFNIQRVTIGSAGRSHVGLADLFLYETTDLPPRVTLPNIPLVGGKFTYINAKKII